MLVGTIRQRFTTYYIGLLTSIVLLFFIDLATGKTNIRFAEIINYLCGVGDLSRESFTVLNDLRLPRVLIAILAGAALGVSGLLMQTIFRNPLAGPYVLGISGGASLGVAMLIMGMSYFSMNITTTDVNPILLSIAAFGGSMIMLLVILSVSFRVKDIMTLLIFGMLFGSITSSIITILEYFSEATALKSYVMWTMGSLQAVSKEQLVFISPIILLALILSIGLRKPLNAMVLGENYARSLGLNINKQRIIVFIATSLLSGTITAFCGPIGFIGIAVPHIARMLLRTGDHLHLIIGSAFIGANALLLADIISHLPSSGSALPINAITALIGIPVILLIILKKSDGISVYE